MTNLNLTGYSLLNNMLNRGENYGMVNNNFAGAVARKIKLQNYIFL